MSDLYLYSITYAPRAFLHCSPYNASSMLRVTSVEGNVLIVIFQWVLRAVQTLFPDTEYLASGFPKSTNGSLLTQNVLWFWGSDKAFIVSNKIPRQTWFLRAHFLLDSFYFLLLPCGCWDKISFLRLLFGSIEARSNLIQSFKMLNKHLCLREMHLLAFSSF